MKYFFDCTKKLVKNCSSRTTHPPHTYACSVWVSRKEKKISATSLHVTLYVPDWPATPFVPIHCAHPAGHARPLVTASPSNACPSALRNPRRDTKLLLLAVSHRWAMMGWVRHGTKQKGARARNNVALSFSSSGRGRGGQGRWATASSTCVIRSSFCFSRLPYLLPYGARKHDIMFT
jgi:hypothetical protein